MCRQFIDKLDQKKANFLYFFCIFIALFINIVVYRQSSFDNAIEILGTFIQIALPCYVIVPILLKKDLVGAKQMLLLLFFVLVTTYLLKYFIPAKRPYGGSMSFPSGHTAGAFTGAFFLMFRYGRRYSYLSFPLAVFVGASRIYTHNHWPIDVLGAVAVCFIFVRLIVKRHIPKQLEGHVHQ